MTDRTVEVDLAGGKVRVRVDAGAPFQRRFGRLFPSRTVASRPTADLEIRWSRGSGEVRRNGRSIARGRTEASTALLGEWVATSVALDKLRSRALLLHAAWVDGPQGGILLVGAHGSGKSTLSLALELRHGRHVLADDVIALDANGRPRPVERPVRIKPGAVALLPELRNLKLDLAPFRAGWPVLIPLRRRERSPRRAVRAVFILERRGSGPVRLRPEGEGRGLAALARHVSNFRERPAEALAALARVVRRAPVWRLSGGTLDERCRTLSTFRFR
ncbi:MAG: hypothetical protein EHM91_10085 [Planctomycetota bacterium]|nr:MAG: hypothetical protein EHM91_10085 [Planctomycetota bacterium]